MTEINLSQKSLILLIEYFNNKIKYFDQWPINYNDFVVLYIL
jgi:hypothetical protein